MPSWMPTTAAERAMWMLLFLLVGGYLGGQWLNRQQTKRAGKWIQAGLKSLGGRVTWHWSKTISAGAEANVEEARAPYRNLAISYYLLTREFAPLWLWEQVQGQTRSAVGARESSAGPRARVRDRSLAGPTAEEAG